MKKIKQNPRKVFAVVAGVFFIAAILFMLLPGITFKANEGGTMSATLFAFITGGKVVSEGTAGYELRVNGMIVVPFMLLILAMVFLIILICGLFTGKFKKKTIIVWSIIIVILVIASSAIIFASKTSMIKYMCAGKYLDLNDSRLPDLIKGFESIGKFSFGAGAILTPIMMLLGAASLGGVICLSAKK